jgi:hypothetical protein
MALIIFDYIGTHEYIRKRLREAGPIKIERVAEALTQVAAAPPEDEIKVGGSIENGVTVSAIESGLSSLGPLVSNKVKSLDDLCPKRPVCIIEPLALEESSLQDELSQTGLEVIFSGMQAKAIDGSCVYNCLKLLSWIKAVSGIAVIKHHAVAYVAMPGAEVRRVAYDFAIKEIPYSLGGETRGFTMTAVDFGYRSSSSNHNLGGLFGSLYNFIDDFSSAIFPMKDYSEVQRFFDLHGTGITVINEQTLNKAYHTLALKLHPDKPTGDKEAFQKLNELYNKDYSSNVDYSKWQGTLQSVKLFSKAIDCTIDFDRDLALYNKYPTQEHLLKVGMTAVTCVGYYTGNPLIIGGMLGYSMVNNFHKGEYQALMSEMVGAAMLTIVPPFMYEQTPRLAFVLDALYTGYSIDTTLDKAYSRLVGSANEEAQLN